MALLLARGVGVVAATLVCTASGLAHAQDSATAGLAYGTATQAARATAPELAAGRARADVAAAGVGVARIYANPVAGVGTTTDGPRFFSSLTVPLPVTRRGSAIRAAESISGAAATELPLQQLDATLGAAEAWCALWLAERTREVADASESRAAMVMAAADQRYREGAAPRLDAARAKAEHARTRAEARARAELVADSSAALAYWLGRDPTVVLHVAGAPPDARALPPVTALFGRLEAHPLFARAAARSRAATALIDVQKSQAWPTFGVQLGATLADRSAPANNLSAGLVFDVPVFNWNGPAIKQAQSGAVQVVAESGAATARLRSNLVSAYANLKAAMARADAAEQEVLPASQIAADLTRDAYQSGAVDLSAVLVAEKALADAKQAAFDAVAQRGRAVAALERALGGPL
ncbi:MAG TPA: TolC family protein [Labilithrix sp.]|nr:TolC family protein [Labilithrix sp.]